MAAPSLISTATPQHILFGRRGLDHLPISIKEAGIDVVGALHPSDWLQADAGGLERHDVHQAVLEFVARQVGTDES